MNITFLIDDQHQDKITVPDTASVIGTAMDYATKNRMILGDVSEGLIMGVTAVMTTIPIADYWKHGYDKEGKKVLYVHTKSKSDRT